MSASRDICWELFPVGLSYCSDILERRVTSSVQLGTLASVPCIRFPVSPGQFGRMECASQLNTAREDES